MLDLPPFLEPAPPVAAPPGLWSRLVNMRKRASIGDSNGTQAYPKVSVKPPLEPNPRTLPTPRERQKRSKNKR